MGGKLIQRPQTEEKNMTILRWPFSAGYTSHLGSVLKNPSCLWNTQKAQLGQEPPGVQFGAAASSSYNAHTVPTR